MDVKRENSPREARYFLGKGQRARGLLCCYCVEFKETIAMKDKEIEDLQGEVTKQYMEGFDTVITQVNFLHLGIDISPCGYFKEI